MQQICNNEDFFVVQAKTMQRSIEEDKWYMSEKEHRDVGWDAAEEHFVKTYFLGFAAGFRASYCALVCPNRKDCAQAQRWL